MINNKKSIIFSYEATSIQDSYGEDSKSSIVSFRVHHRETFCPVSVVLIHTLTHDCHLCTNTNPPSLLLQRTKQKLHLMAAAKYVNVSNAVFMCSAWRAAYSICNYLWVDGRILHSILFSHCLFTALCFTVYLKEKCNIFSPRYWIPHIKPAMPRPLHYLSNALYTWNQKIIWQFPIHYAVFTPSHTWRSSVDIKHFETGLQFL